MSTNQVSMQQYPGWALGRVVTRREWAPGLITLGVRAEIDEFQAGQFVNLGVSTGNGILRRAYSMANASTEVLEFYLNLVPEGVFTPRLFERKVGDELLVERRAQGFFTLNYVPLARDLWMVATGTGLAPFMSILRSGEVWTRFERIILVHGVRRSAHLSYADELAELSQRHGGKLTRLAVVSRDDPPPAGLAGRITSVLSNGSLELRAETRISPEHSHFMLCGNPEMIADVSDLLQARQLRKHRVRRPGHISVEKYW